MQLVKINRHQSAGEDPAESGLEVERSISLNEIFGNSSCEYTAKGCRSLREQSMRWPFLLLTVLSISLQEAWLALLHSPCLWLVLEKTGFADSRHCLEMPTSRQFDLDLQKAAYIPISRCRCTSEEKVQWSKIHEHFQHLTCFQDWMKSCRSLLLKILPSVSYFCNSRKLMSYPCICATIILQNMLWSTPLASRVSLYNEVLLEL